MQIFDKESLIIPHIFPIRILNGKRDLIKKILEKNKIQTGLHYKPNHLLKKFKTSYNLPVSEKIYDQIITLPLHPEISDGDVYFICSSIINNIR